MISPIQAWVAERTGLKQKLTGATLQVWQLDQVKKIVKYARKHSKFYAGRLQGIDAEKLISISDMESIPFTWPEDIAHDYKAFICVPEQGISRIVTLPTSGSRGMPKRICFTLADLERTVDFFAYGMSAMVQKGQSVLILMSGPTQYSVGDLLLKGLARIGVKAHVHGNVKEVQKAIEAARGIDCLIGVPGEVIHMCRTDESLRPESVLLSADYVPESVIKSIEKAWKCRVFTHYGMTETGFGGGVQCGARLEYHLRDADLLMEIIDRETGRQVVPGQYGEVTVTTLSREAMPLIRYRTGDIARIVTGACSCGGVLPRLGKVMGRYDNNISLNNGGQLSIYELDEIMYAIHGIRNYRAKLLNVCGVPTLSLTVDKSPDLEHEYLLAYLASSIKCRIKIQIQYDKAKNDIGTEKRHIAME